MVAGHGEAVLSARTSGSAGILRKGHEALADVAGRRDVGLPAQTLKRPPSSAMATTALVCTPKESSVGWRPERRCPADDHRLQRAGVLIQRPQVPEARCAGPRTPPWPPDRRGRPRCSSFMPATFYASLSAAGAGVQHVVALALHVVTALGQTQIAMGHAHPIALRLQVVARGLGKRHRPVLAAGAAHADGQLLLALGDVPRHDDVQKSCHFCSNSMVSSRMRTKSRTGASSPVSGRSSGS